MAEIIATKKETKYNKAVCDLKIVRLPCCGRAYRQPLAAANAIILVMQC